MDLQFIMNCYNEDVYNILKSIDEVSSYGLQQGVKNLLISGNEYLALHIIEKKLLDWWNVLKIEELYKRYHLLEIVIDMYKDRIQKIFNYGCKHNLFDIVYIASEYKVCIDSGIDIANKWDNCEMSDYLNLKKLHVT